MGYTHISLFCPTSFFFRIFFAQFEKKSVEQTMNRWIYTPLPPVNVLATALPLMENKTPFPRLSRNRKLFKITKEWLSNLQRAAVLYYIDLIKSTCGNFLYNRYTYFLKELKKIKYFNFLASPKTIPGLSKTSISKKIQIKNKSQIQGLFRIFKGPKNSACIFWATFILDL